MKSLFMVLESYCELQYTSGAVFLLEGFLFARMRACFSMWLIHFTSLSWCPSKVLTVAAGLRAILWLGMVVCRVWIALFCDLLIACISGAEVHWHPPPPKVSLPWESNSRTLSECMFLPTSTGVSHVCNRQLKAKSDCRLISHSVFKNT